ncbi:MAG TPA: response regulator [Actinomycetes bacterium]|jgi:DNA-binding NarL/FixJ family response regulator|nr:response regulator [Actinomycetes bacterium]
MTGPCVLIVDDHALVAQTLALALRTRAMQATVATDLRSKAVLDLAVATRPQLVLLDLDLGGGADGTELVPGLRATGSRVLVVTGTTDRFRLAATVAAGAVGWVDKSLGFDELVDAVERVARGGELIGFRERSELLAEFRAGRAERSELRVRMGTLAPREHLVLRRLAAGLQAEAIALELHVSVHTVRAQIRSIHRKLDVTSQLAAVAVARSASQLGVHPSLDDLTDLCRRPPEPTPRRGGDAAGASRQGTRGG